MYYIKRGFSFFFRFISDQTCSWCCWKTKKLGVRLHWKALKFDEYPRDISLFVFATKASGTFCDGFSREEKTRKWRVAIKNRLEVFFSSHLNFVNESPVYFALAEKVEKWVKLSAVFCGETLVRRFGAIYQRRVLRASSNSIRVICL